MKSSLNSPIWLVLAAYYPPEHIGGGEVSDHWIFKEAALRGYRVTVYCQLNAQGESYTHTKEDTLDGVRVIRSNQAAQLFRQAQKQRQVERVFISGPATLPPWWLEPRCHPTLILRTEGLLDFHRPLIPLLHRIVVPSYYLKEQVAKAWSGYPVDDIIVSYPNISFADRRRPWHNPRFITLPSAWSHKGVDIFLAMAKLLPNEDFLIADNLHPEAATSIKRDVQAFSNLFVSTTHESMEEIYLISKLLLTPSVPKYHIETFGKVLVEAVQYGVVPLTYPLGGPLEYLTELFFVARSDYTFEHQVKLWVEKISAVNQWPLDKKETELDLLRRRINSLDLPNQAARLLNLFATL